MAYSETINLDSFKPCPENERYYLAIGENRQGFFKIMVDDFTISCIDIIKGSVLGYKTESKDNYVLCHAYSKFFRPLKEGEEIPEYKFTLTKDSFQFERI